MSPNRLSQPKRASSSKEHQQDSVGDTHDNAVEDEELLEDVLRKKSRRIRTESRRLKESRGDYGDEAEEGDDEQGPAEGDEGIDAAEPEVNDTPGGPDDTLEASHIMNLSREEIERQLIKSRAENAALLLEFERTRKDRDIHRPRKGDDKYRKSVVVQVGLVDDKDRMSMLRAAIRKLVDCGGLDDAVWFRHQPRRIVHQICKAARRCHPFLRNFDDDWATREIIKDVLKNRRSYQRRKAALKLDRAKTKLRKTKSAELERKRLRLRSARNLVNDEDSE